MSNLPESRPISPLGTPAANRRLARVDYLAKDDLKHLCVGQKGTHHGALADLLAQRDKIATRAMVCFSLVIPVVYFFFIWLTKII